jgi:hypothetical protein
VALRSRRLGTWGRGGDRLGVNGGVKSYPGCAAERSGSMMVWWECPLRDDGGDGGGEPESDTRRRERSPLRTDAHQPLGCSMGKAARSTGHGANSMHEGRCAVIGRCFRDSMCGCRVACVRFCGAWPAQRSAASSSNMQTLCPLRKWKDAAPFDGLFDRAPPCPCVLRCCGAVVLWCCGAVALAAHS